VKVFSIRRTRVMLEVRQPTSSLIRSVRGTTASRAGASEAFPDRTEIDDL
jgi:hypothetical protein